MEGDNPINIAWSIKGYHVNRLKPPPEVTLDLQREPQNRFDPHAVIVKIPRLHDMPQHVQGLQCHTRAGIRPLREMAGRTVGHVPANLCRVFAILQDRGLLLEPITANTVARAQQTVHPPVWARFRRGAAGGRDRAGGGAEVSCTYHVHVHVQQLRTVMALFEQHLPRNELWRFRV